MNLYDFPFSPDCRKVRAVVYSSASRSTSFPSTS